MNKQREVIYAERSTLISTDDLKPIIMEMVHKQISEMVDTYLAGDHADDWDAEELLASLKTMLPIPPDLTEERLRQLSREEAREGLLDLAEQVYAQKEQELGEDVMRRAERWVSLNVIDSLWVQHLTAVDDLREGIGLRAYGQRDPLVEYKAEAFNMFQGLLDTIQKDIVQRIFHVRIVVEEPPKPAQNVITNREEGEGPKPVKVANKVGRNDPCPCGSGKKYKKCHGK